MKFKNKFKTISIITATTLPIIVGSTSDIVNQKSTNSTRSIKTNGSFLKQNYDKQFKNADEKKPFNQLVNSEQKLTPSDLDLLNTNPFNYFEKSAISCHFSFHYTQYVLL